MVSQQATEDRLGQGHANARATERVVIGVALAALAGLVAFLVTVITAGPVHRPPASVRPQASALQEGDSAPSFRAGTLGARAMVHYVGHSSEPVVLNFFASWCGACAAELKAFGTVSAHTRGATFIGIDSEDPNGAGAQRLLQDAGVRYVIALDRSGVIAARYRIAALPVTFIVSPQGTVLRAFSGTTTASELQRVLRSVGARVS